MEENENFVGGEETLRDRGVEVVNFRDAEITKMMGDWSKSPAGQRVWSEDT